MCQLTVTRGFGRPFLPDASPPNDPTEHPTSNIQHPTLIDCAIGSHWVFDVGCWMLDVLLLRLRTSKREHRHSGNSLPEERGHRRLYVRRSTMLWHLTSRTWFLPLPTGEGWGGRERSAPSPTRHTAARRLPKPAPPSRIHRTLTASISTPADLFGSRISAFLRPSDFGPRISLLPYSSTP
jgi:hypothetical protein